jgi:hypothetical protein
MEYIEIQVDKKFLNFYEITDHFLNNFFTTSNELFNQNHNHNHNPTYKFCYECEFGSIEFVLNLNNLMKKKVIVHEIYIKEPYRNQGLCKEFIKNLIDKLEINNIFIIQTVISKILYNFLLRFKYRNKKFILKIDGFVYVK